MYQMIDALESAEVEEESQNREMNHLFPYISHQPTQLNFTTPRPVRVQKDIT